MPERLAKDAGPAPVLDVLATPLAPRFGGVSTQLGARRAEEARLRTTALLAPEAGWWTLRVTRGGEMLRARLGRVARSADPSVGLREGVEAVRVAVRLVGAQIVNVEGVAGWPPAALRELAVRGGVEEGGVRTEDVRTEDVRTERAQSAPRLVVSVHDFALFCPRPNLVEEPHARFCGYSRDVERCRACLAATWGLPAGFVEEWRRDAAGLLAAADAVVYPSEFLRRQHAELFSGPRGGLERVLAPPAPGEEAAGPAPLARRIPRDGEVRIAFVGAYRPHKGALVFGELLRKATVGGRRVRWSILGSGDPELVLDARRSGARAAGHYRAGGLTRRLLEEEVDVALLLSIWPETYSLTLTECRAAGVPVVAFDLGAIGERIGAEGGGVVVPVENGAEGVAAVLAKVLSGEIEVPPFRGGPAGASGHGAAAERMDLYATLLGGSV